MNKFNPREAIPENLRRFRKEKGLKQKDVSEETGIDNSTLSKFESGAREPDWGTLLLLCDYYNVSFAEMVGGEEAKEQVVDEETQRIVNLLNSLSEDAREHAIAMLYGLEYKMKLGQSKSRKS